MLSLDAARGLDVPHDLRIEVLRWLEEPRYASQRGALQDRVARALAGDVGAKAELEDAFSGSLPIGTGGRRGTCGPGPNRMNEIVLRETAQGLARAMGSEGVPRSVVIAYDTRRDSRAFAGVVAEQLARLGIAVLLLDAPRPTPLLSFTVRARGAGAGVVISASHNPPEDNGIKIYWDDGAQVLGERDANLMRAIEAARREPLVEGEVPRGAIEVLATPEALATVDEPYLAEVSAQGLLPAALGDSGLRVVYTPLHGVGHTLVLPLLRARGIEVAMVEEQGPDGGRFASLRTANPEQEAAFERAAALAERTHADLVIANDPDADRLGALVRDARGSLQFVDGHRLGVLMLDHVLRHAPLPPKGWVVTTLVTTPLLGSMARAAGVEVVEDLLVGFKHHAGMLAEAPQRPCVFATEESHGFLRGNEVRDKDGAIAAMLLCEAAADAKRHGMTLFERLDERWIRHGYHRERTANLFAPGVAGRAAIAELMRVFRTAPPDRFAEHEVEAREDRCEPRQTGSPTRDLPGDVLVFRLRPRDGIAASVIVRPSGTEPKAKIYVLARSVTPVPAEALAETATRVDRAASDLLADARARAESAMGLA